MSQTLSERVAALPEVYQVIYGHPEWDRQAARDCLSRLEAIAHVCELLSSELGRPLRIIDLGCAQGFFSLSLAAKGAVVTAIDYQPENIALCQALAGENPQLHVTFIQGQIEDAIEAIQSGQYDLALGLSVFHHIVYFHGKEKAKLWINQLVDSVRIGIFELAQRQEPLYWAPSQPNDAYELIEHSAFWYQISSFATHLSPVERPMFVASNRYLLLGNICRHFDAWRTHPYAGISGNAHNGSRHYYFGDDFVCKVFDLASADNRVPDKVLVRNKAEISREASLLQKPPPGLSLPQLIAHGIDDHRAWLMMSRLEGELLSDLLLKHAPVNIDKVLEDLLQQVVALEQAGLWHDDIRLWNVIYNSQQQSAILIDYGSVGGQPQDCVWPHNIFQAFFILVNELLIPGLAQPGRSRPVLLSPFHLPSPYANWLYAFWQIPMAAWRFSTLASLFACRASLPAPGDKLSGVEAWLSTQELHWQNQMQHLIAQTGRVDELTQRALKSEELLALCEQQLSQLREEHQQQERALQPAFLAIQTLPLMEDKLNQLREEVIRLDRNSQASANQLQAVYHSRSWRITAPYRYLGMQLRLLRQYGFTGRGRHLIRRLLNVTIDAAQRYPTFKRLTFNLLRRIRLYEPVKRLWQRAKPTGGAVPPAFVQQQIQQQLINPSRLPPAVREIYRKLS